MAVRIICIKRDEKKCSNPYIAIDYLEWINEKINIKGVTDRDEIYNWLKEERGQAYILDENGNKRYLIPATCPEGNKYVKTVNDETADDYLLALPDCILKA